MKRIELPSKIFIDREQEKARLGQLLKESTGGIISIKGNIGVGKTRLVREVLNVIAGKELIWGDCSYLADYVAYYPIRELVKHKISKNAEAILPHILPISRVAISRLVPDLSGLLQKGITVKNIFLNRAKFCEAIGEVLKFGDREKIIVIDNLQWIDQGSTRILMHLIRTLKSESMVWLLVYRADEETEVLKDFLAALSSHETIVNLSLQPFARADVVRLASTVLGEEPAEDLVSFILHETGGNAYYIEEVMRSLVLDEHLIADGETWRFIEPQKETVPKSIEDIALTKFLSLDRETQDVVSVASIIGWFDIALIKEISGLPPTRIIELIQNVHATGLIRYSDERIEFSDDISRHAVYNSVSSRKDIATIHQRIGDRLKERAGTQERMVVNDLAFHYYRAHDVDKGVRFCREAAEAAKEKFAYLVAIKYINWALDLLQDSPKKSHLAQRDELDKELHFLQSAVEQE